MIRRYLGYPPGTKGRGDVCLSLFMCSALSAAVSRVDTTPSSTARSCRKAEQSHTCNTCDPSMPIPWGVHRCTGLRGAAARGRAWGQISPGPQRCISGGVEIRKEQEWALPPCQDTLTGRYEVCGTGAMKYPARKGEVEKQSLCLVCGTVKREQKV